MQSRVAAIGYLIFLVVLTAVSGACSKQNSEVTRAQAMEGPADKEIASVLALIKEMPDSPLAYNQLAILYIKKARQTGDFSFNTKAESAVQQALTIAPSDGPSRKMQASLHLTFHRFREALDLGNQLQREFPGDSLVYGILTDANAELGNYSEAVAAAQRMVDLKPNSSSYARVAHLRSLHGDHAGAVEMFRVAARITDPQDKEAQSWCLVQLGDELWKNGRYEEAETVYDEALRNFPNYYLGLEGKGRVRAARNDLIGAAAFLTEAQNRLPKPATIVLLGDVYMLLGEAEKARLQYALLEAVEQTLGSSGDQNSLALYLADRDLDPAHALVIAQSDYAARKDIYTVDVLAWCLYKNGNIDEAKKKSDDAVRLKTGDARITYHAGMIESALGNRIRAAALLAEALKQNPAFDLIQARVARMKLEEINRIAKG